MKATEFISKVDQVVRDYSLLYHPFYQAWMQGLLSRNDLREYSIEYYRHVAAFPMYLREFARRLPAGELRNAVFQNLLEEEGRTGWPDCRSHASIWVAFADSVGSNRFEICNRKSGPKTQQLIDLFFEVAKSGPEAEAVSAFYVYEAQVPTIAASKAATLRDKYGIKEDGCEYFVLHSTADVRHASVWRELLLKRWFVDNKFSLRA